MSNHASRPHKPHEFKAHALDVRVFAKAQAGFDECSPLSAWERLSKEHVQLDGESADDGAGEEPVVRWQVVGEFRQGLGERSGAWLLAQGSCGIVKHCQRCMQPVQLNLFFEQAYRFVATEEEAEAIDLESEEDVLAYAEAFNLLELVEDELLLAIPAIPRHDDCGGSVQYEWMDNDFEQAQPEKKNPFAILEQLKKT